MSIYEHLMYKWLYGYIAKLVCEIILRAPNTIKLDAHFRWGVIESDPDDNKFVDCAIVANANFIVTEDNHFNVLKHISFPHVNVLKLSEFDELMSKYR